jgi:hypothetical protein
VAIKNGRPKLALILCIYVTSVYMNSHCSDMFAGNVQNATVVQVMMLSKFQGMVEFDGHPF